MLLRERNAALMNPETNALPVELAAAQVAGLFRGQQVPVDDCTQLGYQIMIYGASTRGLVIMESLDLSPGVVEFAAERKPREVAGGPLLGDEHHVHYRRTRPGPKAPSFLVLPYHFIGSIISARPSFLRSGGELIVPLPEPMVIRWDKHRRRAASIRAAPEGEEE